MKLLNVIRILLFVSGLGWSMLQLVQAQLPQPQPTYRQYTVEDGLPSSEVYHVIQDSKGYLWFATDRGVSRYDGYSFRNFSLEDGLPDNTVFNIIEDYKGRIWFTSLSGKLAYYEEGKITSYAYNALLAEHFTSLYKSSFYVDRADNVYVSAIGLGYFKISNVGELEQFNYSAEATFIVDEIDSFIFLSTSVLSRAPYKLLTRTSRGENSYTLTQKDKHIKNCISLKLSNGILLFSSWDEIVEINSNGGSIDHRTEYVIISMYEDQEENLWIGTSEKGVYFYEDGNLSANPTNYLRDKAISSILQDREGAFWFTTLDNGVYRMASRGILTYDETLGLSSNQMGALVSDNKGTIFAASRSGPIQIINDSTFGEIELPTWSKSKLHVNSLLHDQTDQLLYIATDRSEFLIFEISDHILTRTVNPPSILDLALSNEGQLLAGTNGSALHFANGMWKRMDLSAVVFLRLSAIYQDPSGVIWVGGPQGLGQLVNNSVQFNPLNHPLLNTRVSDISSLDQNILCVATRGGGLLLIKEGTVKEITVRDGLTSDIVESIYIDGNQIWLATNKGLNSVKMLSFENWEFNINTYDVTDGLASNEIRDVHKLGDNVWFTSNKGVSFFNPNTEIDKKASPLIWLTGLRIGDQDTSILTQYDLQHDQNNLVISYLGISFKEPGKARYKYKMEGLDSVWEYTSNTSIKYTTLPHGSYRFTIVASNSNGSWSTRPATMLISISPPWWKSWWFMVSATLLATLAISLVIRFRVNQVKSKLEAEAITIRKIAELELKALRAQMSPHFTFNIMNAIQHFITDNDPDSAQRYLTKFARLIRTILESSEKEKISLTEEIEGLTLYMELEALRFEEAFVHEIIVASDLEPDFDRIPPMLIQPYVENAIWHGLMNKEGQGTIRVELSKLGELLKCTIEDNGIGRGASAIANKDKEKRHKSMGIQITQERLDLLNNGNLNGPSVIITDLKNKNGDAQGTLVEILVPIR